MPGMSERIMKSQAGNPRGTSRIPGMSERIMKSQAGNPRGTSRIPACSTVAGMTSCVRTRTGPEAPSPSPVVEPAGRPHRTARTWPDPPPTRHLASDSDPEGPRRSVLICDDRPGVRHELARALRFDSLDLVREVPDAATLLAAYEESAVDRVLIGVHSGTTVGTEAVEILLAAHPDAAPIVIGSVTDLDLLAAAYARGAGGLLLWEPETLAHEPDQH